MWKMGSTVGRAGFQTTWAAILGARGSAVKRPRTFSAVKTEITMQRASVWEKNLNVNNEDECGGV